MKRYTFEYQIKSTKNIGEFSQVEETEEKAKKLVHARIADFEFVDEDDVVVGKLIKTSNANKEFHVCESCSS
ncbi:hypothetical protein CN918_29090 [Priestia megaterium]|nr:hypothetical protein CN918_29090 [Priestia megaterium]